MGTTIEGPLGRRPPVDWNHVRKYPLGAVIPEVVDSVEQILKLPRYRRFYNQNSEGACVGYSLSWMMSILNRKKYDAPWLYKQAKFIDEWTGESYDGTSVRAGCDILRDHGHRRVRAGTSHEEELDEGISTNRWARTVDEIRTAISWGIPVTFGINWYANFDTPKKEDWGWWIGRGNLGTLRGGHAICCYGASDQREAFKLVNSWGIAYPPVWLPFSTVERLISEDGEVALVTDR